MPKRYYLCDLIGDGSNDNPYRPAIQQDPDDYSFNFSAVYPQQDPNTGQYQGSQVLVIVNTVRHTPFNGRPGVDQLPDFPLDAKLNAMQTATFNAMKQRLAARGYPSNITEGKDGYRDVIRAVGRSLQPTFHEDDFDVSD